ncbi:MAG: carbamate kinase [Actinobacteria bacterium]|nr:MAG: carbamate kinase [Actinomycetota bacterium]
MRLVVALGGNAILRRDERGTAGEQRVAVREACDGVAALASAGNELVVVHGNGPQVGALLIQNLAAREVVPPMPLDMLVAQTQGGLGYLIQQELAAALARHGVDRPVVTLVTQVVVDRGDRAFRRPTKPIGPHLSSAEAAELRRSGVTVVEVPGGAWRRVVPSPRPIAVVEEDPLRALLSAGATPIVAGGGGIPVTTSGDGYEGVEGVVDKDFAAGIVAEVVGADALVILTDIERVLLDRGTRSERAAAKLTLEEVQAALDGGQFPPGSMGPKIEAAIAAVRSGRRAIICSLGQAAKALEGAGTEIVP